MPDGDPRAPVGRDGPVGCVVVGAGAGTRMGAGETKILLDLDGTPVIGCTLRSLAAAEAIDAFVVVCRSADRPRIEQALAALPIATRELLRDMRFVPGGAERHDSVREGVAAAPANCAILLVHDAARPFVRPRLVRALIDRARACGAAAPVLAVSDTLKRLANGRIVGTVDREGLHRVQTPQAFRAPLLREALAALATGAAVTDDVALLERLGHTVEGIEGDPTNLKITSPADLELARALLPYALARIAEDAGAAREERAP